METMETKETMETMETKETKERAMRSQPALTARETLEHDLHAELATTRRELKATRLQLVHCRRELRTARTLLATLAHEINNPLAYIQSNLCSLSRYADKIACYAEAVTAAEPVFQRDDAEPRAQRLAQRLRRLRARLKLDFVLEDLEPLVQQSLRGTARVQRVVQALKETAAGAPLSRDPGGRRRRSGPNVASRHAGQGVAP